MLHTTLCISISSDRKVRFDIECAYYGVNCAQKFGKQVLNKIMLVTCILVWVWFITFVGTYTGVHRGI